jgi:hypothetical protein
MNLRMNHKPSRGGLTRWDEWRDNRLLFPKRETTNHPSNRPSSERRIFLGSRKNSKTKPSLNPSRRFEEKSDAQNLHAGKQGLGQAGDRIPPDRARLREPCRRPASAGIPPRAGQRTTQQKGTTGRTARRIFGEMGEIGRFGAFCGFGPVSWTSGQDEDGAMACAKIPALQTDASPHRVAACAKNSADGP